MSDLKKRRASLDGIIIIHNDYQGNCSLTYDADQHPATGLLTSHLIQMDEADARKKNKEFWSGVPMSTQGAYYRLIPHGGELSSPARYESMKEKWEKARGEQLDEPVWEAGVSWDIERADYVPYSTLLKLLRLAEEVSKGNSTTFNKLVQLQSSESSEDLPSTPTRLTSDWIDDVFPSHPENNPEVFKPHDYQDRKIKTQTALEVTEEIAGFTRFPLFSYDKNDLGRVAAQRKSVLDFLKPLGFYPPPVDPTRIEELEEEGCPNLLRLLKAIERLNSYAGSMERRRWNPDALQADTVEETSVALDWFIFQNLPSDWDPFDSLARLERIWKDGNFTGPGFIYTKLFGQRIRLICTEGRFGQLVLSAAEILQVD